MGEGGTVILTIRYDRKSLEKLSESYQEGEKPDLKQFYEECAKELAITYLKEENKC